MKGSKYMVADQGTYLSTGHELLRGKKRKKKEEKGEKKEKWRERERE